VRPAIRRSTQASHVSLSISGGYAVASKSLPSDRRKTPLKRSLLKIPLTLSLSHLLQNEVLVG
ncbi:MAG TPA: hypothetical protein DCK98_18325, partial [Chloroflexi bacterium]|nr:hypothetical protein [Chloroflexota bacterium]HAL28947.1 hypothetical protein [Chloroflexota bacterium]